MVEVTTPKILLIVEDQILLAMGLKDELEDGGYRMLELADRHQEALGLAREIKPDLALVNIDLAHGDDGVALARDLKALGVPVLFISGQVDRARLGKAVAIASLAKPYSGTDMVDAVDYLEAALLFRISPRPLRSRFRLCQNLRRRAPSQDKRSLRLPNQLKWEGSGARLADWWAKLQGGEPLGSAR